MSTIRIFRVLHKKYSSEPFSGKGGLYASSRWASKGQLVSYAAGNLTLAALEKIAGAGRLSRLGKMVYVPAELTSSLLVSVRCRSVRKLIAGAVERRGGATHRDIGNAFP